MIFGVGVGSKNVFGICAYRLTIFVFKVSLFLCSIIYFEFVVGGGWWFFGDYRVSPNFLVVLGCGWGCGLGWAVTINEEPKF